MKYKAEPISPAVCAKLMPRGYKAYPSYKYSGVEWLGDIPDDWVSIRFKQVFDEKKKKHNQGLNCGSISFGEVVYKDNDKIPVETRAAYQEVLLGEFLINPLNLNFDLKSLRTALSTLNVVVSTGYIVLTSKANFDKNYLRWLLYQFDVAHMKTLGAGVRQTVNFTDIGNSYFYQPCSKEQKSIANYLDKATAKIDTLIEKQTKLIELLKEKRQAVISSAVTRGLDASVPMKDSGVEWLGEIPEHWVSCKLKYYGFIIDCKHITAEFTDEGVPLASIREVKDWFVNLEQSKKTTNYYYKELIDGNRKPRANDIIYSRNATVGEAAIVNENHPVFAMGQDVCLIRANQKLNSDFLLYCLKSKVIFSQLDVLMIGSTFKRVNVESIRTFSLSLPSVQVQIEIVKYLRKVVSKIDDLINKSTRSIDLLKEKRTALISAAVTGKIDVRDAA